MGSWVETAKAIRNDLPSRGVRTLVRSYLYNPAFRMLLNHRLGKYFARSPFFLFRQLALRYRYRMVARRSCDISYNAVLGRGLRFPHPIGIVIGDGTVIGDRVTIFQQVTFGSHGRKSGPEKQYPIIRDDVTIYAGAKIIGGIEIGKGAVIGANSVVNVDVPPNAIAVGIPCRIILKST